MKYFYRPHRGGLKEAMEERKFFDTLDEMTEYIVKRYNDYIVNKVENTDISYHKYGCEDRRIGWKSTYIILIKGHPFGFFTDNYDENWEKIYNEFLNKL